MQKKNTDKNKPEILKKIKDIVITRDELFGLPLERTFVQEVHFLRESVASRLNALTTGYNNIAEENKLKMRINELVELELYCCGHQDTWFLVIKRDGTIVFEKRDGKAKTGEEYVIPSDWDDKQILNYQMPERLVKEHLKRISWLPVCFQGILNKAEKKLAENLATLVDREQKQAIEQKRILTNSINILKAEIKREEVLQAEHDSLAESLAKKKESSKPKKK